ncbi:MAG: hypothetical protein ACE5IK_08555 [Acidobacteriota bacterium]
MAPALVTLLLLSWVGLTAVVGMGYAGHWGLMDPARHVTMAIPAFLLGTLAHAMTMFYFIGTGKVVKEAVAEAGLTGDWVERTKEFKQRTFPAAMWAIGLIMATAIIGGAVDTGRVPDWIHGVLGLATIVMVGRAAVFEIVCISANLQLMDRLDGELAAREEAKEPA